MRIESTSKDILGALKIVGMAMEKRNTIPIVGMVRFKDGEITGTNLDLAISTKLPMKEPVSGDAAIDLASVSGVLKCLPKDEDIFIDIGEKANVCFNGSSYSLSKLDGEDYPDFQAVSKDVQRVETSNYNIADAIKKVRLAISTEATRYYLNGVCFSTNAKGDPVVVATNGHMMACKPISADVTDGVEIIMPRGTVDALMGMNAEPSSFAVDADKNRMEMNFPAVKLESKLIDGTFPDWKRVVPVDPVEYMRVDLDRFMACLKRLRAFKSSEKFVLSLSCEDGRLEITRSIIGFGSASERMPCISGREAPFKVGYNGQYLFDVAKNFAGSEVLTFSSRDGEDGLDPAIATAPCVITGSDTDLMCVLMPMRV